MVYDAVIIGAGVTGGMLARELMKYRLAVCICEKENDVACGASKANSGIVHGGYDPVPGTLKARLNAAGVEKLFETAKLLHVPVKRCGSLVCAFSEAEATRINELYERGLKNGISGISVITGAEARKAEPNLSPEVCAALSVENSGIVCPYELTIAAVGNAMDNGAELKLNFEAEKITEKGGVFTVISKNGESVKARYLINCAGGYSDKIAELLDDKFFEIIPRAGEYMLLDKTEGSRVSRTIFRVPTKEGKGVLVSPTVDGNLLTGPTSAAVASAESRETTPEGLDTVARLASNSVPGIDFRGVITSFTGVRASEKGGDFIIEPSKRVKGLLHVAAIDSPGLTCCVAIAEYAAEQLKNMGLRMEKNPEFNPRRENPHAFREMTDSAKNEYIKIHPEYGRIVCRCETVSEGEIRDAVRRNPKTFDIDGIKRRTRAGMGRCQGGFCAPYVMKILSEENGIPMEKVTKNGGNSYMVSEREGE